MRKKFNLSEGLDVLEARLLEDAADSPEMVAQWKAFRATLTPEQLEALWPILRSTEAREYAIGARLMLRTLATAGLLTAKHRSSQLHEGLERQNVNLREQVRRLTEGSPKSGTTPDVQNLRERVKNQAQALTEIHQALADLKAKHRIELSGKEQVIQRLQRRLEFPHPAAPAPDEPATWDYQPATRRRVRPDEHAPNAPAFGVQTAARIVEETVRKHGGQCSKVDVSTAHPHLTCLADAYRHLHLSGRVIVQGMTLRLPAGH